MLFSDTSGFMELWLKLQTRMRYQFYYADEAETI